MKAFATSAVVRKCTKIHLQIRRAMHREECLSFRNHELRSDGWVEESCLASRKSDEVDDMAPVLVLERWHPRRRYYYYDHCHQRTRK